MPNGCVRRSGRRGPRLAYIDRRGIDHVFDMRRVIRLDHLDARSAVLGDLVDVSAFHQAHTDVGMPQAVDCARLTLSIHLQVQLLKNGVEELPRELGK